MSAAFRSYLEGLNDLRRAREEHADDETTLAEVEERIEARLDEAWKAMTGEEQEATWLESWRAFPEKYARRMRSLRDENVWKHPRSAVREIEAH